MSIKVPLLHSPAPLAASAQQDPSEIEQLPEERVSPLTKRTVALKHPGYFFLYHVILHGVANLLRAQATGLSRPLRVDCREGPRYDNIQRMVSCFVLFCILLFFV